MQEDRKIIENRIFQIITYINNDSLLSNLKENLNLFSYKELLLIRDFLESWNLEKIYIFLLEKNNEYLLIIEEIKALKIKKNLVKYKQEEQNEEIEESSNLELLINLEY